MISVYHHITNNNMTHRDEESIARYVKLIQWGRSNPVQFIERVLGVPLMDYQRWLVSMTWAAKYAVWVCSRNAGKSFLLGNFLTARALLFPKQKIWIMSTGSRQAGETFETMENIVKRNVASLKTQNTVFIDELAKSNANTDGFLHNAKDGNSCALLNGSEISSVVGTAKTVRGKRSTCNAYDEAGTIDKEFFEVTEPFMAQSSEFVMTDDSVNRKALPNGIPNLRLYIGSASDTSSEFYRLYREGFKQMLKGNPDYFVADINCEIPMHPTRGGVPMTPLLDAGEIERKRRENEILANREYHNIFDRFNLEDSLVSRSDIAACSDAYPPQTRWGGKKHKYVLCYDPSSKVDNAPVLVGDVYRNEHGIWEGRIVNMVNLVVTYQDGSHKPMLLEEQVNTLRKMMYEYNGREKGVPYENVTVLIDAGSGGQAPSIVQELVKDWTDELGAIHPGIIDENSPDMVRWGETFPHAVKEHMRLLEPRAYRNGFFEAMKEEIPAGHIRMTCETPRFDILVMNEEDEKGNLVRREQKLGRHELDAMIQIDLMKEEAVSIVRSKTPSGNVTYGLPPEKKNKMHDDRVYVLAMFCWWVKQLQIDEALGDSPAIDYQKSYLDQMVKSSQEKKGQIGLRSDHAGWGQYLTGGRPSAKGAVNPFAASKNPFH